MIHEEASATYVATNIFVFNQIPQSPVVLIKLKRCLSFFCLLCATQQLLQLDMYNVGRVFHSYMVTLIWNFDI